MLIQRERVIYEVAKLYIDYDRKGDIQIYSLKIQTVLGEEVTLYVDGKKNVIDFVFDATIAELNASQNKVIDMNYIIANACG